MPFDTRKFMAANFEPRTREVTIFSSALADFFDKDEKPVFVVRGLTAAEMARSQEAAERTRSYETLIQSLTNNSEQIEIIKETLGISTDDPRAYRIRLEQVVLGSVSPKLDITQVVKIAHTSGGDFASLSLAIMELSGEGMQLKKLSTSGDESK